MFIRCVFVHDPACSLTEVVDQISRNF